MSLRWKLVLASFVVIAVPLVALNRYTLGSFDRFTRTALEATMISHASILGEQYRALLLHPGPAGGSTPAATFAALLQLQATNTASRLTLTDTNGLTQFDSAAGVGADWRDRPEIRRALRGHYAARWALTPDRHYVYYYCALPVRDGDRVVAVACVTRHTGPIKEAIQRLTRDQRHALAASLGFAAMVSLLLGHTLTRRLRRLSAATRDYAQGFSPPPPAAGGRDEIGALARAIDTMARDLEARHRYNRDFVATVLHELRTPVTAIRGAAEVLEAGAVNKPEARARFLGNIRFEADRLTRLVGELSDLTRVDHEDLRERLAVVDYPTCLCAIVERLVPTFEGDHAPLTVELPEAPLQARVVPERIEQVVANLLENAFRYTPRAGRVVLSVVASASRQITTVIADTGPGIVPANLERIFERFYTTEPKGVPRDFGMGLGLAVAKAIIENHQGRIWAENAPGGGARLCFTLPVA